MKIDRRDRFSCNFVLEELNITLLAIQQGVTLLFVEMDWVSWFLFLNQVGEMTVLKIA